MKQGQRILAMLLCAVLCLSMLPTAALAEEVPGGAQEFTDDILTTDEVPGEESELTERLESTENLYQEGEPYQNEDPYQDEDLHQAEDPYQIEDLYQAEDPYVEADPYQIGDLYLEADQYQVEEPDSEDDSVLAEGSLFPVESAPVEEPAPVEEFAPVEESIPEEEPELEEASALAEEPTPVEAPSPVEETELEEEPSTEDKATTTEELEPVEEAVSAEEAEQVENAEAVETAEPIAEVEDTDSENEEKKALETEEETSSAKAMKGSLSAYPDGDQYLTVKPNTKLTLKVSWDWEPEIEEVWEDPDDPDGNSYIFSEEDPATFSYKWVEQYTDLFGTDQERELSDGNGISGAATDTLVLDSVPRSATYRCEIEGSDGSWETVLFYVTLENSLQVERDGDVQRTVNPNVPLTLKVSVTANDTSKLKYEWRFGGDGPAAKVLGTGEMLKLESVQKNGEYICTVTDQYGGSDSTYFRVYVNNRLMLTSEATGNSGFIGNRVGVSYNKTAKLKVLPSATDMSQLSYRWYEGTNWDDQDTILGKKASFTTPAVTGTQYYICVLSDQYGNRASCSFEVYVENHLGVKPALDGKKTELEVTKGEKATLQVEASAGDTSKLSYCWYNDKTGREKTLGRKSKITTIAIHDHVRYTCVVTDQYGNEASCEFTVTPKNNLKLTAVGDTILTVKPNGVVTLKVKATAKDKTGLSYRWTRNGYELSGKKSSLTTEKLTGSTTYTCTATDRYGKKASVSFQISIQNNLKLEAVGVPSQYNNNRYQLAVKPGAIKTLKVKATADDTSQLTYYWSKYWNPDGRVGNNWPGETLSSTKPSVKTDAIDRHYTYQCRVSDQYGNSAEVHIEVYVDNHLSIRSAVKGDNSSSGQNSQIGVKYKNTTTLKVKVTADDTKGLKYSWYRNWYDESGAWRREKLSGTKASLTTAPVIGWSRYLCSVADQYGHQVQKNFDVYVENHLKAVSPLTDSTYWDVNTIYVSPGTSTTLKVKVTADNTDGLSYTWTRHPGADNFDNHGGSETLSSVTGSIKTGKITGPYIYQCLVEDRFGGQKWCTFRVMVDNHLQVLCASNGWNSDRIMVKSGAVKTLKATVTADDRTGLHWQWYKGEIDKNNYEKYAAIEGATRSSVKTDKVTAYTVYRCDVTDRYGQTESCWYYLGINNNLKISTDIESRNGGYIVTVPKGQTATLRVNVSAKDRTGLKYIWREAMPFKTGGYEWRAEIPGAKKSSYTTPAVTEAKYYICVVTDRYGTTGSILFKVYPENRVTLEAAGNQFPVVKTGSKVTLKVRVTADDKSGLSYQWVRWDLGTRRNVPIAGATKTSYTAKADRNAAYRCWVTDRNGAQYMLNFIVTTQDFAASKPVLSSVTTDGKLTWKLLYDAEGIEIQRRKNGEKEWTTIEEYLSAGQKSYTDSSAKKGVKYEYRIIGHFGDAVSRPSKIRTVIIK